MSSYVLYSINAIFYLYPDYNAFNKTIFLGSQEHLLSLCVSMHVCVPACLSVSICLSVVLVRLLFRQ